MSTALARRAAAGLAAIGAVLALYALSSRCLADPDLGWHLATGRSIVLHRAIPRVDDLAIAHASVRYVVAVSDVLLYLVTRAAGARGLQVFGALLPIGTAALVFFTGRRTPLALLMSALVLAALNAWVSPSAAPFSYPLLAATMLLVDRHRRDPVSRGGRVSLYALVPLMFVWANTHGSVAIGVAIVLAYALTRLVRRDLGVPTLLVAIAAVLAATLNPAGPRVLLATSRFGESLANVTEWKPPTSSLLVHHEPLILVIGALGIAALAFGRDRRELLFDVLAVASSLAAVSQMTRMIPLAAIVIAPIVARRFDHLVPRTPAMALASSAATIAAAGYLIVEPATSLGSGFDPVVFPVDATSWVERTRPAGRMWNFWPFGGYLAWRLGPEREVLIDGRNTLAHDRTLVDRADASIVDHATFESLVDEWDLQWAITRASSAEPTSGAGIARSARFTMTYLDDVAAVYVRSDGPNAVLARSGYRILRHDMPPGFMLEIATGPSEKAREALAHDGDLGFEQAPASKRSAFVYACGAIAARDEKKLESALSTLARLDADPMLAVALRSAQGTLRR